MKREKVTIYLSEENIKRLKEESKRVGMDESEVVGSLIQNHRRWSRMEEDYWELRVLVDREFSRIKRKVLNVYEESI